jgi:hypothetical protein
MTVSLSAHQRGREAKPAVVKCLPLALKRNGGGIGLNGDEIENKLPLYDPTLRLRKSIPPTLLHYTPSLLPLSN